MDSITLEYEAKVGHGFDFIKLANALVEPDEPEMEIDVDVVIMHEPYSVRHDCLTCSRKFETEEAYREHLEEMYHRD